MKVFGNMNQIGLLTFWIREFEVDIGRNSAVLKRQCHLDHAGQAGGSFTAQVWPRLGFT